MLCRAPLGLAAVALLVLLPRAVSRGQEKGSPAVGPSAGIGRGGDALPPGALACFGSFRGRVGGGNHIRAAYNPARHLLATAGFDSHLHVFHMDSGHRLCTIEHDDAVAGPIAFSPDGAVVALESRADVYLHDTASGRLLQRLQGHLSRLDALTFSADGRRLATVEGQDIRVWDPATGKTLLTLKPADGYHRFVVFSPDAKLLAVLCDSGDEDKVRLWEVESGKERPALAVGTRQGALAFSPDGKVLAAAGDDLQLWDWAAEKRLRRIELPKPKYRNRRLIKVGFSPDGRLLATAVGQTILLYAAGSGKEVRTIQGKPEGFETSEHGKNLISCLGFSSDGKQLITWASEDRARSWDVATGKEWRPYEGHQAEVVAVLPLPDGRRVYSWADDDRLCLWDLTTGRELPLGVGPGYRPLVLSPDGRTLVGARPDERPVFLDVATGKQHLRLKELYEWFRFSPDGKTVAGLERARNRLVLWQVSSGKILSYHERKARHGPDSQQVFAFAPDSRTAFVTIAGSIRQVEVGTERVVRTFEPGEQCYCTCLAVSPDGTLLAGVVAAKTIRLWTVATGKELRTFDVNQAANLRCLAFSPDNCSLAGGSEDNTVRVWEVALGELRREFEGHQGQVQAVAFVPDGKTLISGSKDWTALVWDLTVPWAQVAPQVQAGPLAADSAWRDLGNGDGVRAYHTLCLLIRRPGEAVPFLRGRLKEFLTQETPPVEQLIKHLDHDNFEEREKASAALEQLGKDGEEALHRALAGKPSPEVRLRVERLLEAMKDARPTPEQLRLGRAIEVLEHVGTPEARDLLRALARTKSGTRVPQQARAALLRLERAGKQP